MIRCVPGAIPPEDRAPHLARIRRLFGQVALERKEIADGRAFRFAGDELEEVTSFVALERLCCPFLSFVIEVEAEQRGIWLHLSGPAGSREVIDLELLSNEG